MPGRTLLFVGILIMAMVGPYMLSQDGPLRSRIAGGGNPAGARSAGADSNASPWTATGGSSPDGATSGPSAAGQTLSVSRELKLPGRPVAAQQLGGPAGISLADAIRFEATPSWVAQNWARVTTQLSDPDYHGLRVPLVTGTESHDVAGSLSFYFNSQNECERITFFGYTGDYEPLAALMQSRYGLRQFASVGPGLFLSFQGSQPLSVLRVEDAAVQMTDRPRSRYRVILELNRPRQGAALSSEMFTKLQSLRDAKML